MAPTPKEPKYSKSGKLIIERGSRSASQDPARDGRWWAIKDVDAAGRALWSTCEILRKHHGGRHMRDALYYGMYDGSPPYWAGNLAAGSPWKAATEVVGRGTLNVFRSGIETASSMVNKNLAEVRVMTNGGIWKEQQRARGLTKYLAGAFDLMKYHQHRQRMFVDGCITRARGLVKFWVDFKAKRVRCARVHPRTILWNDMEGDQPLNLYQRMPVPRSLLMRDYPELADRIEKAPSSQMPVNPAYHRLIGLQAYADMVDVVDGWHRATGDDMGRHIYMLEGCVLNPDDTDWRHEWFPFADFSWADATEGWGGRPAADTLYGYQERLNKMLRIALTALGRSAAMAGPWFERTVAEDNLDEYENGEMWAPRYYTGQTPQFVTPNALGPDFWTFFWRLKEEAFAELGLSTLQAQGLKPAGLDSGEALVQYNDITATRQVIPGQRLERTDEQAAVVTVGLTQDLAEKVGDLAVLSPGQKTYEQVPWKDVDPKGMEVRYRSFAVSALPTHVVGRIDAVAKMIKSGLLPADEVQNGLGIRLLNFPDLEKIITLQTANQEMAQMQVDAALYDGKFLGPEPFQDLALLKGVAQKQALFAATLKGVPDKNMDYVHRLMQESDDMLKKMQPAPATTPMPGPPGAGAPPPGMPLPPQAQAPIGGLPPSPAVPSATPAGVLA